MHDRVLYNQLKKLASSEPSLRPHIVPLLRKHAAGVMASRDIDSRHGWDEVIVGDKVRIRWKGHPHSYAVIEELPQKGKRHLKRFHFEIGSYLQSLHSRQADAFMLENLKLEWRPSASMTAEGSASALRKAIDKAIKNWEKAAKSGKAEPIPDWFTRSFSKQHMPHREEVFYLNVEPRDYAPVRVSVKDQFYINAEWTKFEISLNGGMSDAAIEELSYGGDPYYTKLVSKSPTSARKFFKWVKANEKAIKSMTGNDLTKALDQGKIQYSYLHSVWR